MARRRVPSFDDRLRRTPRIRSVTIQGSTITVEFKDRMDTRRSTSVFRVFTTASGVVEYVGASWVNEFRFTSNAATIPGAYTGPSYARYMSGNLRNKSRFELLNGTRCDRILVQEDEVVTGAILAFGGTAAPSGYLLCDGSVVSRTTYAALFAAIGTNYGAGDGSTTFKLPDLRGRTIIGTGQGSGLTNRVIGANVGAETHVLTIAQMPAHNHELLSPGSAGDSLGIVTTDPNLFKNNGDPIEAIQVQGGGAAHNNMQPSQVCTFIIKT